MQFYFIRKPLKSSIQADGKKKFSFLDALQEGYNRLLDICFHWPKTTVGLGVFSVVAGAYLMSNLPQKLMPTADRNQFAVEITLPTETAIDKTTRVADSLSHILQKDPRILSVTSFKGCASPRFHTTYAPQIAGTNYAQFIINTTGVQATEELLDEYTPKFTDYFPEASVRFKQLSYSQSAYPIEIRLSGESVDILTENANKVVNMLHQIPELRLIHTNFNEPQATTKVVLKEDEATRLGVSNMGVETTLAMRYGKGLPITNTWEGDYNIPVVLKSKKSDRSTPQENAMALIEEIQGKLNKMTFSPGITLNIGGDLEESEENMPPMMNALVVAAAIIFFILVVHFHKINIALLIFASMTLYVLGAATGILVQGVDFSVTCVLGLISLMGIIVRNGIIMIDYAEELRKTEKLCVRNAIYQSARRRMRPIFLTSAAASMGVIPMILGKSGLWMPMGTVICYGTLITMLLLLTVLPVSYWLIFSGSTRKRAQLAAFENE